MPGSRPDGLGETEAGDGVAGVIDDEDDDSVAGDADGVLDFALVRSGESAMWIPAADCVLSARSLQNQR